MRIIFKDTAQSIKFDLNFHALLSQHGKLIFNIETLSDEELRTERNVKCKV